MKWKDKMLSLFPEGDSPLARMFKNKVCDICGKIASCVVSEAEDLLGDENSEYFCEEHNPYKEDKWWQR